MTAVTGKIAMQGRIQSRPQLGMITTHRHCCAERREASKAEGKATAISKDQAVFLGDNIMT